MKNNEFSYNPGGPVRLNDYDSGYYTQNSKNRIEILNTKSH